MINVAHVRGKSNPEQMSYLVLLEMYDKKRIYDFKDDLKQTVEFIMEYIDEVNLLRSVVIPNDKIYSIQDGIVLSLFLSNVIKTSTIGKEAIYDIYPDFNLSSYIDEAIANQRIEDVDDN